MHADKTAIPNAFLTRKPMTIDANGAVVTPPAATAEPSTTGTVPPNNATATPPADGTTGEIQKKDPEAGNRYAIMQERQRREAAEKRIAELEAKAKEEKPTFTEENDPDGKKEMEYLATKKAEELFEKKLKELGLDSKVEEIQRLRAQDEFFSHVNEVANEFSSLWVTADKEAIKSALDRFETKGISARELVVLANLDKFMNASRPKMDAPGEGAKVNPADKKPTTNEEVYQNIFKKFGLS